MKKHGCRQPALVITDLHMGANKLDGVETAIQLRKIGYNGPILLRSSDSREEIEKIHPNFEELMKDGTINSYLNKTFLVSFKEVVENYLFH